MSSAVLVLIGLVLSGPGRGASDQGRATVDPGRPFHSHSGRPFFSTGIDRSLISTGRDRGLTSTGQDRGLISMGRDRGLISTGTGRPLASVGRDRALLPMGGLDAVPAVEPPVQMATLQPPGAPAQAPVLDAAPASGVPASLHGDPASTRFAGMMREADQAMQARAFPVAEQILYSVRGAEPQSWDARFRYATALLAMGHYDRSLDELAAGIRLRPRQEPWPRMAFGSDAVRDEVVKQLHEYRELNPGDPHATLLDAAISGWDGPTEASATLIGEVRANHPGWEMIRVLEGALPSKPVEPPAPAPGS